MYCNTSLVRLIDASYSAILVGNSEDSEIIKFYCSEVRLKDEDDRFSSKTKERTTYEIAKAVPAAMVWFSVCTRKSVRRPSDQCAI